MAERTDGVRGGFFEIPIPAGSSPEDVFAALKKRADQLFGQPSKPSHEEQIADMRELQSGFYQSFKPGDVVTPKKACRLWFAGDPCLVIEAKPETSERYAGIQFMRLCRCGTHYEMDTEPTYIFELYRPKEAVEEGGGGAPLRAEA